MAFCVECGSGIAADDQFCANCGSSVVAVESSADGGFKPHGPATRSNTSVGTVEVPDWVTGGWGPAATWAAGAAIAGLLIQYAIVVVIILGTLLVTASSGFGFGGIDWSELLRLPVYVWLGMHGAVEGTGMWLTSIAWIAVAFYLTRRLGPQQSESDGAFKSVPAMTALDAAKGALVYSGIVLVGLIFLDPIPMSSPFGIAPGYSPGWQPAVAFFSSFVVAFGVMWGLNWYSASGRRASDPDAEPNLLLAGLSGTLRILAVAIVGLLALVAIGGLLQAIGDTGEILGWVGWFLLTIFVAMILLAGLDVGMVLFEEAMAFFPSSGDQIAYGAVGGNPRWLLIGTAIVAVAFLMGGYWAARKSRSSNLTRLLQSSGIAGLGVVVAFVIASLVLGGRVPEIRAGIGLSIIWSLVAVVGGGIYARSIGLSVVPNVQVASSSVAASTRGGSNDGSARTCPDCGDPVDENDKFCGSCGHAFA
jgi:hypothetical protein